MRSRRTHREGRGTVLNREGKIVILSAGGIERVKLAARERPKK